MILRHWLIPVLTLSLVGLAACDDDKNADPTADPAALTDDSADGNSDDSADPAAAAADDGTDSAEPDGAGDDGGDDDGAGDDSADPAAAADQPAASDLAGRDFIAEARMLYRVVACAGDDPIPDHLDRDVVSEHCAALEERKSQYRTRYVERAKQFLADLKPDGLPDVVVYPFGGGDLISALVAYPDAREITTMSLEHGGDPRRIRDIGATELAESLEAFRREIGGMLSVSNNTSVNLSSAHTNLLPAQLSSFLVGLAVHDLEPVSVRYFRLEDDGTIHYYDDADIKTSEDENARQLKHDWAKPNFSPAFSHVETQFRARGAGPDAPVRVHRHMAVNLANRHFPEDSPVLAHLRAKGRVVAMTKAASYLLWNGSFSRIRDYLLEHLEFMISDSTGIPPRFARRAGMVQTTYGRFTASFLDASEEHNLDFQELWAENPYRRVPFRFGYIDAEKQRHLLITRPSKRAAAKRRQARE
ncbi:MAG: hypothetical protein Tsb0020_26790 [Haliangiales bacterium]